jgi:hypothetical protein
VLGSANAPRNQERAINHYASHRPPTSPGIFPTQNPFTLSSWGIVNPTMYARHSKEGLGRTERGWRSPPLRLCAAQARRALRESWDAEDKEHAGGR